MGRVTRADRLVALGLGAAMFVVCALFFTKWPTEWDSVQLVLGVDHFDIEEHSPHPPGYYLYLLGARFLRLVTPLGAHAAMQVLSALAAAFTVGLTYLLGIEVRNRWAGMAAALFIATSPFHLFYGTMAASYCFDGLLLVVLLLLAVRARPGSRHGLYSTVALGFGSGLRPSSVLVLFPLVLWALARSVRSVRQFLVAAVGGAVAVGAWVVPMLLEQPGGPSVYFDVSDRYSRAAFRPTSMLYGSTWLEMRRNMVHASAYVFWSVLPLVPLAVAGAVSWVADRERRDRERNRSAVVLLGIAVAVPYLFLLVVHFGKAGYVLSFLPAAGLLAVWQLAGSRRWLGLATALVVVVCGVNAQRYFFGQGVLPTRFLDKAGPVTEGRYGAPFPVTRAFQGQVDREVDDLRAVAAAFDAERDVVVYVFENGGVPFRHGCLTLPQFRLHFVNRQQDQFRCEGRHQFEQSDKVIELSEGGRAVWALASLDPAAQALVDAGRLTPQRLPSGRTVYVAGPGVTLWGVTTQVAPDHDLQL